MDMNILFEDDCIGVVNKPPKMLVHRTEISNRDTKFALQEARKIFGRKVWPVYRLDRGTSGALMFAFSEEIVARMQSLTLKAFKKRYFCICRGWLKEETICEKSLSPVVDPYLRVQKTESQEAKTIFEPLAQGELPIRYQGFDSTRICLIKAELCTGRRHQIRRHLKFLSHPIIGDATYGKGPLNRDIAHYFGYDRLYLHCALITFVHPLKKGDNITIKAALKGEFLDFVTQMGWEEAIKDDFSKNFIV